jgi:hypothetical protein
MRLIIGHLYRIIRINEGIPGCKFKVLGDEEIAGLKIETISILTAEGCFLYVFLFGINIPEVVPPFKV